MFNESVNNNTHFLLVQLLAQITDLGKGTGLASEVAKAVYPLIYSMNNDKSKNKIEKQLHNFQKQLPKEFKVALNKIRSEYLSDKADNLKDQNQLKLTERKDENSHVDVFAKDFIKEGKNVPQKNIKDKKNPEIKQKKNIVKKELKKIKRPTIKNEVSSKKESFKKSIKSLKSPIDIKNRILPKNQSKVLEKNFKTKIDSPLKGHTIQKGSKDLSKTSSSIKREKILLKILKTTKELQKVILTQKQANIAKFKPTVPLTLPFVAFHPKKERIEKNITEKEKFKLQRVCEIEPTGEDKDDSKKNK